MSPPGDILAGPDGPFVLTGACNLEAPGSNTSHPAYLLSCLCIYNFLNSSKTWSVQCCI